MKYREKQREYQKSLIATTDYFSGAKSGGIFMGRPWDFVITPGCNNLRENIREEASNYFSSNKISWWAGDSPSGHLLSSQIACINHLFPIRKEKSLVLQMLNSVRDEFVEVLPIPGETDETYIAFEAVSYNDHLNEGTCTRGSNCTSVDALIYALHKSGKLWLIPIEWKYTEFYPNQDKSNEDRKGEPKGSNGKGHERLNRYSLLINNSKQLQSMSTYEGSIYFQEPFYQLMRQTLWAEQIIEHKETELLKADDFMHIHVIPAANSDLLEKRYAVSGMGMEDTWRSILEDQSKYRIVDPQKLLDMIKDYDTELVEYLDTRYWQ